MFSVFDPRQLAHTPVLELHNGAWVDHVDRPARAESIADAVGGCVAASDFGMAAIARVHAGDYLEFLEHAHARWLAAGRTGDAIGYVWPVVARRDVRVERIDALLGRYSFDASTPIAAGTWTAAYWAAQTALTALAPLLDGRERTSFAVCRPPGHHAGRDYLGGYCYLNNAAIAARAALDRGVRRVAILDIDYHHGNGTQDIFYTDPDVLFASIHGDPVTEYPFYWGHADERGAGPGEGTTLNLPLPRGTTLAPYLAALERALDAATRFAPGLVVVSFGADTYEGDPISHFKIATAEYTALARRIAALALPTLIVMEGGYAVDALGGNVRAFLAGF